MKRSLINFFYLAIVLIAVLSCDDEEAKIAITDISSSEGVVGDTVTVYGSFPPNSAVSLEAVDATVVHQSSDSISFIIPEGLTAGVKSIAIGKGATAQFSLLPNLLSIDKHSLTHDEDAIIKGTGFSTVATENQVLLGSEAVAILEANFTELKVRIPKETKIGSKKLSIVVASLEARNKIDLTIYGWQKIGAHPRGGFYSCATFAIGDAFYFLLGIKATDASFTREVWRYDLSEDKWERVRDFPGNANRISATAFALNEKGYVGMGYALPEGQVKDFWKYDPVADTWTRMPDFPGLGRTNQTGFVIGAKGFVGLGISNGTASRNDFYSFDPAKEQWAPVAAFPGGEIYGSSAAAIGTNAYVVGGVINNNQEFKQVWEYNSLTNTWTRKADFPGDTSVDLKTFGLGSFIYSGMGWVNPNNASRRFWTYDPAANVWTEITSFPGASRFSPCFGITGKMGYYGFGSKGLTEYDDVWVYLGK